VRASIILILTVMGTVALSAAISGLTRISWVTSVFLLAVAVAIGGITWLAWGPTREWLWRRRILIEQRPGFDVLPPDTQKPTPTGLSSQDPAQRG
jgi:hypothetical protein